MAERDDELGWVEQSRQGGHEAFEQLVLKHQQMIYAVTYRMMGTHQDAQDLAQETFIRAFQSLESFNGESRFSSWLYRIAVNLCLNDQRSQERRERVHQSFGQVCQAEFAPSCGSETEPVAEQVKEALMRLPAKQRAAIVLTVHEGFSQAEAARVLGCSEATVAWRVFAAKAKLKHWLREVARREESLR